MRPSHDATNFSISGDGVLVRSTTVYSSSTTGSSQSGEKARPFGIDLIASSPQSRSDEKV